MTEEQLLKLHGLKGCLAAYVTIQQAIIEVAQESKANCGNAYLDGYNDAQVKVASKAIEQHLVIMAEVDDLLREAKNV